MTPSPEAPRTSLGDHGRRAGPTDTGGVDAPFSAGLTAGALCAPPLARFWVPTVAGWAPDALAYASASRLMALIRQREIGCLELLER